MRIGVIGTGFVGRAFARLALQHGHDVMLSNCRDPKTLASAMIRCKVGTAPEAAEFGEVVLAAVPFRNHRDISAEAVAGKIVLDANDYDPGRDGELPAASASEAVALHFAGALLVKILNPALEKAIERETRPSGAPDRRALAMAGDDAAAKIVVSGLFDQLGFDVVDAGALAEGWRFQRGQPAYAALLGGADLRQALVEARPAKAPAEQPA
jgi:predicted dinucleotide-binding enzyme